MPRRLIALALATLTAVSLSACSSEADAKLAAEGLAFFKSTEALCNDYSVSIGRDKLNPKLFANPRTEDVFTENDQQFVQVVDGAGNLLFVNLTAQTVQAGVRPDEVMPKPYLRGCPVDLYMGVAYELEKQG